MQTKNVFITIAGRANAGKSSLLNALVGEKIAAVSSKPQTTRTRITGILTKNETQYIFFDTPGAHKAKTKLSAHMTKTIEATVNEGELLFLVADCTKKINEAELALLSSLKENAQVVLLLNKIDLLEDKNALMMKIAEYTQIRTFEEVIPVSVIERDGLELVMAAADRHAVVGPHYFPDDKVTDQPERVLMAELIREKALQNLNDEIPHGIAVGIESLEERESRAGEAILDIGAVIYCEKESHKGIVIGKNGAMLKRIGVLAREELEEFFQIKVNLKCWVKVKEGWRNREGVIRNFGLNAD
ncbi:MAG: GTPase Era [Oscillospiraceae bacterium]